MILVSPFLALALSATPVEEGDASALAPALVHIDAEDLREHLTTLAADTMAGRCAGESGCDRAADFLARRLAALGLDPAGDDGSFFQDFDFGVRGGPGASAGRNVVALLEGSDPRLKEEVVVVGAHYDHVGTVDSPDAGRVGGVKDGDDIWNGADDNGSGSVAILEMAEALSRMEPRPRRSIVFVWFSAEEHGLLGSQFYCKNPAVPMERTVAMVNLDMVGRNPKKPMEILGLSSLRYELWKSFIADAQSAAPELELDLKEYSLAVSDHDSFLTMGVPATFLFTGLHDDYHKCSDHVDKIEFERMVDIARFATALVVQVANTDETLEFQKPRFQPRGTKSLDINAEGTLTTREMQELGYGKSQGGFRVTTIRPDSPGDLAGLKVGDVILRVRGKTVSPDDAAVSLRRLVAASPSAKDVRLVVWRNGEEVELVTRF